MNKSISDNNKIGSLFKIIFVLIILQVLLNCFESFILLFCERTNFVDSMVSMISMIIMSILFILFCKKKEIDLSIFPKKFTKTYIIFTFLGIFLLVLTPSNFSEKIEPILLLIYSSIVTPIFEEIIFRGYAWNKLNIIFKKEYITYIIDTLLFGLWHLGYISSIAFRADGGLSKIMFWKVIVGICFGIILGALRIKTKNVYSTIFLHGLMNIFGR